MEEAEEEAEEDAEDASLLEVSEDEEESDEEEEEAEEEEESDSEEEDMALLEAAPAYLSPELRPALPSKHNDAMPDKTYDAVAEHNLFPRAKYEIGVGPKPDWMKKLAKKGKKHSKKRQKIPETGRERKKIQKIAQNEKI